MGAARQEAYGASVEFMRQVTRRRPDVTMIPRPVVVIARTVGLHYDPAAVWRQGPTQSVLLGTHILCGGHLSPIHVRFCIAHEIGHYVLGTTWPLTDFPRRPDPRAEKEADAFAAGLLMPHGTVRQTLRARGISLRPVPLSRWAHREYTRRVISGLAAQYKVGHHVALQSLVDMGLVSDIEPWHSPMRALCPYRQHLRRMGGPPCTQTQCSRACFAHPRYAPASSPQTALLAPPPLLPPSWPLTTVAGLP
jgi:hypothetical protein